MLSEKSPIWSLAMLSSQSTTSWKDKTNLFGVILPSSNNPEWPHLFYSICSMLIFLYVILPWIIWELHSDREPPAAGGKSREWSHCVCVCYLTLSNDGIPLEKLLHHNLLTLTGNLHTETQTHQCACVIEYWPISILQSYKVSLTTMSVIMSSSIANWTRSLQKQTGD